jgi:hypothetical protein
MNDKKQLISHKIGAKYENCKACGGMIPKGKHDQTDQKHMDYNLKKWTKKK